MDKYINTKNITEVQSVISKLNSKSKAALVFGVLNALFALSFFAIIGCDGKSYCGGGIFFVNIFPAVLNSLIFGISIASITKKLNQYDDEQLIGLNTKKIRNRNAVAMLFLLLPYITLPVAILISLY